MLDSTMELIGMAASNSLAVFCVCNLIIVFLLVGTSKPPQFDEGKTTEKKPNTEIFKKVTNSSPPELNVVIKRDDGKMHTIDNEEEEKQENPIQHHDKEDVDELNPIQEHDKEDGDDDELRKRVEEFIEKVNRAWEAEKLKK